MTQGEPADRALALLALLPAALLLLPIPPGPLRGVFDAVEATGAGAALLASLPAAALAAWRGWRSPWAPPRLVLGFWAAAALAGALVAGDDPFGRDERMSWLAAAAALAIAGSGLGPRGLAILVRGAIALALLALVPALLGAVGEGFAGAVGNTGELAGAALPGALAGAALLAHGRGPWRWAGLVAVGAFALHACLAPVLASALALASAAGLAAALEWRRRGAGRAAGILLAIALVALVGLAGVALVSHAPPRAGAATLEILGGGAPRPGSAGDLGGIGVRARIWRSTLGLVGSAPLLGVGPGQFAAAFPPHRDPLEIEASSLRRTLGPETEVEHPHSDPLLALAETGLVGGLLWLALMVVLARRALRGLGADDPEHAAASLAVLGILLGSLVNAHLLANPPAGAVAFPLLGALLASGRRAGGRAAQVVPALAFGVLLLGIGPARSLLAHGRALARLAEHGRPSLADLELAVAEALEARPDSVVARSLRAKLAPLVGVGPRAAIERTRAVLELRPHRVGAWIDLGARLAAGEGGRSRRAAAADPVGARAAFERALELDPLHPIALENLARLELFGDRPARGLELVARLAEIDRLDPARALRLGADLVLHGLDAEGLSVLARVEPRLADPSGERLQALAQEFERREQPWLAEALTAQAHRTWGREHAERGDFDAARRSLFQCLRLTRESVEGGAPRVRLEYAAALVASGRPEEAPPWVEGLAPSRADLESLPAWAREGLLEGGLLGAR